MNNTNAEREAEKTLSLLESARRVQPAPFFYTRLKARMQERAAEPERSVFSLRLSLTMVGFLLLVLLNMYSLWYSSSEANAAVREEQLTSFAEEYELTYTQY